MMGAATTRTFLADYVTSGGITYSPGKTIRSSLDTHTTLEVLYSCPIQRSIDITQLQGPLDLNQLYTFRGGEVLPFLDRRPFLAPLLFDAYGKIRNYFPSSRVFLEVVADSETLNSEQLVVFISTSLSADDAFVRLKKLDKDWWLGALGSAHGELCINVEFM